MIQLQKFTKDDFGKLISWVDSEETLVQFAGTLFAYPLTNEQLIDYLADLNRFVYKVLDEENNTIGHAEIIIKKDRIARFCRIIIGNKNNRGKGIGQLVIAELLNISFNRFHAESATLNVYDWNIEAIKCYKKSGFTINKNQTKSIVINGKVWTALNMVFHKNN